MGHSRGVNSGKYEVFQGCVAVLRLFVLAEVVMIFDTVLLLHYLPGGIYLKY